MTVKERILEFAKACNHSKTSVAAKMGVNEATLRKAKSTSADNISNLLESFPELNPEWLLLGKGDMLKGGEDYAIPEDSGSMTKEPSDDLYYEYLLKTKQDRIDQLERELARLKASIITD